MLLDESGSVIERLDGAAAAVDATTALLFPPGAASIRPGEASLSGPSGHTSLVGVGGLSGSRTPIGTIDADPDTCSWSQAYIARAGTDVFRVYRFRDV